jgi:hypothetical protein
MVVPSTEAVTAAAALVASTSAALLVDDCGLLELLLPHAASARHEATRVDMRTLFD